MIFKLSNFDIWLGVGVYNYSTSFCYKTSAKYEIKQRNSPTERVCENSNDYLEPKYICCTANDEDYGRKYDTAKGKYRQYFLKY